MGSYIIYPIVYTIALLFYVLIRGRVGFGLFLLTLFFFAALRGDVGNDACSYQEIYHAFNYPIRKVYKLACILWDAHRSNYSAVSAAGANRT